MVTNQADINRVVLNYFETLITGTENIQDIDSVSSAIYSTISAEDNEALTREFELEEFRIAISQMHKEKASGWDKFNPAFYKIGIRIFPYGAQQHECCPYSKV